MSYQNVRERWGAICQSCDYLHGQYPTEETAEDAGLAHLNRNPGHRVLLRCMLIQECIVEPRPAMLIWAFGPCSHPSSAGYREAVADHGDGTFTLKDGCRVHGRREPVGPATAVRSNPPPVAGQRSAFAGVERSSAGGETEGGR